MKTTVFAGGKVLWAVLIGALAPLAGGCLQAGDEGTAIDEPQKAVGEARLVNGVAAQGAPDSIKKFEGLNPEADAVANEGTSSVKTANGFDQEADAVANRGASSVKKFSGLDFTGDIVENDLGPNMKDTVARAAPVASPEGAVVTSNLGPDMKATMAKATPVGNIQGDIVENDLLGPNMKDVM